MALKYHGPMGPDKAGLGPAKKKNQFTNRAGFGSQVGVLKKSDPNPTRCYSYCL